MQALPRVVDFTHDERASYYWQLVRRPVDHVFSALAPLATNLGYAVARAAHIVGRVAAEDANLTVGNQVFETYPAAILELLSIRNGWNEERYKGGNALFHEGQWVAADGANERQRAKNAGLAILANRLNFQAAEHFRMTDDEFDAALCSIAGCVPEFIIRRGDLADRIRSRLVELHGPEDWIREVEPPIGYVVFDQLPNGALVRVARVECPTPAGLFATLDQV